MDYEDYIELSPIPPLDSEEGYKGDGASILQKMNKEDIRIYVTLRIWHIAWCFIAVLERLRHLLSLV